MSISPVPFSESSSLLNTTSPVEGEQTTSSIEEVIQTACSSPQTATSSEKAGVLSLPAIISCNAELSSFIVPKMNPKDPMAALMSKSGIVRSQSFTFGDKHAQTQSNTSDASTLTLTPTLTSSTANLSTAPNFDKTTPSFPFVMCRASSYPGINTNTSVRTSISATIIQDSSLKCVSVTLTIPKFTSSDIAAAVRSSKTTLQEQVTTTEKSKTPKTTHPSVPPEKEPTTKIPTDYKSRDKDSKDSDGKDGKGKDGEQQDDSDSRNQKSDDSVPIDATSQANSRETEQGTTETNPKQSPSTIISETVSAFILFSFTESMLTQLFKIRVSHLDVLRIFIEVMKISMKSKEHQQNARTEERLLQLKHMGEVVDSFKGQGNTLLISGIVAGVLAIVSGASPIIGQVKGEAILDKLSTVFSKLKDMEAEKFFDNTSKMTLAVSEMSKATGQVQTAFSESHRAYDEHLKEVYKVDADERTRSLEEIKDNWKTIENFIYQTIQMYHDTSKSLYQ